MNKVVTFGLAAVLLMCGAIGLVSAADETTDETTELSEDYKDGFYEGAKILGQASFTVGSLYDLYLSLGGVSSPETAEYVEIYNNGSANFNEQIVPYVNNVVYQTFGPDDNRTEDLYLGVLPLIEVNASS